MRQTTICVPLEVKPESCARLSALLDELCREEGAQDFDGLGNFARAKRDVPTLHFLSMSVFPADEYDPIFVIEANFDGTPGVFWGQMEAAFGLRLRNMLRCCKRPLDGQGPLYDAVTVEDSRAPIAPYLEARTRRPSVFHHGNRGLTRDRVEREAALFDAVRDQLDGPNEAGAYRGLGAIEVHRRLRERLLPSFPWLASPPVPRISRAEQILDGAKLLVFAMSVVFALSLPGIAAAAALQWPEYLVLLAGSAAVALLLIYRNREPLPGTDVPSDFDLLALIIRRAPLIAGYVVFATLLLIPFLLVPRAVLHLLGLGEGLNFWEAVWPSASIVLWGLPSLVATVPLLVLWLRYLERRDSSHDAPEISEHTLRDIVRREDWIAQNHMGSIVLIKPGILRSAIIRAGHLGLGLVLRVVATDGYLGSMRTIHFAHWAFLNNGSRLLFFSNFDHSWDSYLDDFIEKAHGGLTLAWGCCVGFPPTRFLIYDGASHGRRFKAWALASRSVSRFWFSAYPNLTVNQIERNNRIADGLRRADPSEEEANRWIRDL